LLLLGPTSPYGLTNTVGLEQGRFRILRDKKGEATAVNGRNNICERKIESSGAPLFVRRPYRGNGGSRRQGGLGKPAPRSTSNAFPSSYRTRSRATRTTRSIRPLRSRRSTTLPLTTRSSLALAPGSDDYRRRWPISWTRPAVFGRAERYTEKSAGHSPQPPRNMVGNDAILDHHQSLALRHGDRRTRLRPCRSEDKYLDLELRRRS